MRDYRTELPEYYANNTYVEYGVRKSASFSKRRIVIILVTLIIITMGLVSHMLLKISKGDDTDAYNNNWSYVDNKPSNREPKIDIQKLNQELHEMGELTTVEKTYYYSMTYEDGKVPLLTKHRFSMNYSVCVRAGVDFGKVRARFVNGKIYISIPEVEEQVFYIDPNSVVIYDEHKALFNGDGKEELQMAYALAEEDAREKVDTTSLYALAGNIAETKITDFVKGITGDDIDILIE